MNQDEVILGVDTHLDKHVGAVISVAGKLLATHAVDTTSAGYLQLLAWARSLGDVRRAGIEGTATYGSGLTKILRDNNIEVFEVNRPDRATRRSRGKADPTDAESAACAVLSGRATAIPKEQSGAAYAMRAVSVARRSAVKARTQAINQLRGLLVSAPQEIRERLLHAKTEECVGACARIRSLGETALLKSLTTTLRILAKRWLALGAEINLLDGQLEHLTNDHAPRLRAAVWSWRADGRRTRLCGGRQPRTTQKRSRIGCTMRREPTSGVIWKDNAPSTELNRPGYRGGWLV